MEQNISLVCPTGTGHLNRGSQKSSLVCRTKKQKCAGAERTRKNTHIEEGERERWNQVFGSKEQKSSKKKSSGMATGLVGRLVRELGRVELRLWVTDEGRAARPTKEPKASSDALWFADIYIFFFIYHTLFLSLSFFALVSFLYIPPVSLRRSRSRESSQVGLSRRNRRQNFLVTTWIPKYATCQEHQRRTSRFSLCEIYI